jgi:hypothetical protein
MKNIEEYSHLAEYTGPPKIRIIPRTKKKRRKGNDHHTRYSSISYIDIPITEY